MTFPLMLLLFALVASSPITPTNWMSFLNDEKRLSDIFIPGSHDSGTYVLSKRIQPEPLSALSNRYLNMFCNFLKKIGFPVWNIITPWATTQTQTFFYQAYASGIRYFDLRAGWNGSSWNMFHMEEGEPVSFALYDIRHFLKLNKKEIIIVEISHYFGHPSKEAHQQLKNTILGMLGDDLYPCYEPNRSCSLPTLGMMRSANRRVLLALTDYIDPEYFSSDPYIWAQSVIVNTYADSDQLGEMITFNDNKTMYYQENKNGVLYGKLFKISWTLTPQPETVLRGFLPGAPGSILSLTEPAMSAFKDWAVQRKDGKPSNILITDYVDRYALFPLILKWNDLS